MFLCFGGVKEKLRDFCRFLFSAWSRGRTSSCQFQSSWCSFSLCSEENDKHCVTIPPPVHFLQRCHSCFIFSRAAPCRVNYAWTAWNRVDGYLFLSVRSGVSNRESGIAAHSSRHAGISLTRPRVTVGRDSCADVARRRCQIVAPSGISAFYSLINPPSPPGSLFSHAASLSAP